MFLCGGGDYVPKNLEMIQKKKERKNETSKNGYNERFF